jgi:hypothetical membrane protein
MQATTYDRSSISIPRALRLVGIIGGIWAILVIAAATLAYIPDHPDFSPFTTFMSDMGDTPGWPKILFNSGTLMAVPVRYLVLVLLVLRLVQLGAGRTFSVASLIVGFASTAGTALMTATPFSLSPIVHKTGIGLYFLGVVVLQSLIGVREWTLKGVPRVLPVLSFTMVILYCIFTALMVLYEQGAVARTTPVVWEWLAILSSIVWMLAQSILLARENAREQDRGG